MKREIDPLLNGRVRLRLLAESDLPTTLGWRNQDDIRRWFFSPDRISPEQHRAWFAQYQDRDDDFVFVIEETDTLNRPVGQVSLYHVEWSQARAEFGRLMIGDVNARGLGLATLATACLVDAALATWGVREVYLECLSSNAVALAVYDACGFRQVANSGDVVRMAKTRVLPTSVARSPLSGC